MDNLQLTLFEKLGIKKQKANDWKWSMAKDYPKVKNGLKVFSCFACGGGQLWDINLLAAKCLAVARLTQK